MLEEKSAKEELIAKRDSKVAELENELVETKSRVESSSGRSSELEKELSLLRDDLETSKSANLQLVGVLNITIRTCTIE